MAAKVQNLLVNERAKNLKMGENPWYYAAPKYPYACTQLVYVLLC